MVLLLVGPVYATTIIPFDQAAYAHTFSGDEIGSFMSVIKIG